MANTPRECPGYIVLGVQEQAGAVTNVLGVSKHHDQAVLGRLVSSRIDPSPHFDYRVVKYNGLDIGLIEIPCNQPPAMPRSDFGVLRRRTIYVRRNTQNIEADSTDLSRIFNSSTPTSSTDHHTAGSWEQLYRACDAFDQQRVFAAIVDREHSMESADWRALANIRWNIFIDFDTGTDSEGNFAFAQESFNELHALHFDAMLDSPSITARSTLWVAANGLESLPSSRHSRSWREWNRTKYPALARTIEDLAAITEPNPATLIVFSAESEYVNSVCELFDRLFQDRTQYVFVNQSLDQYHGLIRRYNATSITSTLPHVCQGFRDLRNPSDRVGTIALPKLPEGTVELTKPRANWLQEQLEIVHVQIGALADDTSDPSQFLRGVTIPWSDLNVGIDADREITPPLEREIRRQLDERSTRRINLWHWPGAGASTIARRIAWNLHHDFPTVVAREIHPQETAERLRHIFAVTRLPILVIIDLPGVTKEVVDRLYTALRRSHTHAVLLNVARRFDPNSRIEVGNHYLDAILSDREAIRLANVLSLSVPSKRSDLFDLVQETDRRKRIPFYFGLVAYGKDFKGLESYVHARLSEATLPKRQTVILSAFAYYYGQLEISIQSFGPLFDILPSKRISVTEVLPDYIREILVEDQDQIRPSHYLIAEEILQQELGKHRGRRNWRTGLADLAVEFIDLLSSLPHSGRGTLTEVLRSVLIDRGDNRSPAGPWEAQFSQAITDIPSIEGRQRVLEHLTQMFPEEPHFWAHLGRFHSREVHNHRSAHLAYQRAIALLPHDSVLRHMAGMGWRNELYDLLAQVHRLPWRELEPQVFNLVEEATREFEEARNLDSHSEYNYISQVQMVERVIGTMCIAKGYNHETTRFLVQPTNSQYLDLVDQALNLLSDLSLLKGDETRSQLQLRVEADLAKVFGRHAEAIEGLTNLLERSDSYAPPLRRAIIRAYVGRHQGDWNQLTSRELTRVSELAGDNLSEEPNSAYNLRLWLRAVRVENTLTVDRVAETLEYNRLQEERLDTSYYLYIMRFLQLESGDLSAAESVQNLINECSRLAQDLSRTTSSFEWLGIGPGLASLVHVSTLGDWSVEHAFWTHTSQLKSVRGRIAAIHNHGSGEIELPSGLRVFFIPSRSAEPGGYIAGQDIGREVEFFLGFSYDGLRAWSVKDPA